MCVASLKEWIIQYDDAQQRAYKAESENARLRDALKELIEASGNIYDVSENSWLTRKGIVCPHGNGGFYPSSAHWCDDCFERLGSAIQGSKEALKATE